jgi:hypothetical protein
MTLTNKQESKNLIAWAFIIGYLAYPIIIAIMNSSSDLDLKSVINKFQDSLGQIVLLIVYDYYKTNNTKITNNDAHDTTSTSKNSGEYSSSGPDPAARNLNTGEAVSGGMCNWQNSV